MKYLEWNNIISSHFFNVGNAGKDIHLYLTKKDILQLAKRYSNQENEEEIWSEFIKEIKIGLPGSNGNIVSKAKYCYDKRDYARIDSIELKYPPYIAYLIFLVLPLIEDVDGTLSVNNYYDRLNRLLYNYQINQSLSITDFRNNHINFFWDDLENWANVKNNGDLGRFKVVPFKNKNWIYVGKFFSQCIFPPSAIKRLPELFLQAGMIPDSIYQLEEFKRYLLQYGSMVLFLPNNVIETVRRSDTNELGQSIINTTQREYIKWTGESHYDDDTGTRTKRNDISSRIYLQFQIFSNAGKIEFSYRMKSATEFAEDLNFNGIEIREEKSGYSRTLNLPFRESFQLKDDFNKWVAKFPDKDVRLFISAGSLQFSTDYWIETDMLSRANWMYLFCKNSLQDRIQSWGKNHCSRFENESDLANMPSGYSLFKFLNPKEGLNEIPILTIINEKFIQLIYALRADFRTFTNDFLPEVEILNSNGSEKVYLQYKNNEEEYLLTKKLSYGNRWLLPEDIFLYSDFNIKSEQETFSGNETAYKIVTSNNSAVLLTEEKLPKRDSFGHITEKDLTRYSHGSNVVGTNLLWQLPYQPLFRGIKEDSNSAITRPIYKDSEGNILLSFLTLKSATTAQDFYTAFEFLHSKYFGGKSQNTNFNYSKIKKASLNFFDYLGYLDYEYETKSIVVNPPQLIFIPANKGRKVLLIGGRDNALVNSIIVTAAEYDLHVEITRQIQSNEDLLLPDAITINSFGNSKESFGEKNLIALADKLKIRFNPKELVQVGLQDFCSDIEDYEKYVFANKETTLTYEDWARYIFNPETLQFDKSFSENFDKNFALLEYRLRPWEFYHRLWMDNKCYDIDRNWGKYYMLKKLRKNEILKGNQKVAIPIDLPLPRLLSESIMMCSGIAPDIFYLNNKGYRIYENIPSMFIDNLFHKLGQTPIINNSI